MAELKTPNTPIPAPAAPAAPAKPAPAAAPAAAKPAATPKPGERDEHGRFVKPITPPPPAIPSKPKVGAKKALRLDDEPGKASKKEFDRVNKQMLSRRPVTGK